MRLSALGPIRRVAGLPVRNGTPAFTEWAPGGCGCVDREPTPARGASVYGICRFESGRSRKGNSSERIGKLLFENRKGKVSGPLLCKEDDHDVCRSCHWWTGAWIGRYMGTRRERTRVHRRLIAPCNCCKPFGRLGYTSRRRRAFAFQRPGTFRAPGRSVGRSEGYAKVYRERGVISLT